MKSQDFKPKHLLIEDRFFKEATTLRKTFESKFKNPRQIKNDRFVWDYWHIADQYTLLRTPARHYFSKALYSRLETKLLTYAKNRLGLSGLSEPWLSCYIDGCSQNLHADNPHGPWAFVYSLTPWETRIFLGGETVVSQMKLLSYWKEFSSTRGDEWGDLFETIPPLFNRLLVFDPRLPHGVKEVKGARSPEQGRLVIHGWFTEPRAFIDGPLADKKSLPGAQEQLDQKLRELSQDLGGLDSLHGTLSVRVSVNARGQITGGKILTHTLISRDNPKDLKPSREAIETIFRSLGKCSFAKANGKSEITIPFLFR